MFKNFQYFGPCHACVLTSPCNMGAGGTQFMKEPSKNWFVWLLVLYSVVSQHCKVEIPCGLYSIRFPTSNESRFCFLWNPPLCCERSRLKIWVIISLAFVLYRTWCFFMVVCALFCGIPRRFAEDVRSYTRESSRVHVGLLKSERTVSCCRHVQRVRV